MINNSYDSFVDRLKTLAVLAEKKYAIDHPDVKDGDNIDIRDYLTTLFDLMYVCGIRVPPAPIGKVLCGFCSSDDKPPFLAKVEVAGLALLGETWYIINEDDEMIEFSSDEFYETLEEIEQGLLKRKEEDNA